MSSYEYGNESLDERLSASQEGFCPMDWLVGLIIS
jgi:hypothetical protein